VVSSTRSRSWSKTASASLELEPAEAECLNLEASAFARALPDASARSRYEQLASAAAAGVIGDELIGPLQTMLELVFDTGRPSNRAVLQAIFNRTPRGRELTRAAHEVNRALETLQGQTIAELRLAPAGPAAHTLIVETDRCRLSLEVDRHGARVLSLEAG
jgi:hypothetical protein